MRKCVYLVFACLIFSAEILICGCNSGSQWRVLSPMPVGSSGFVAGIVDDNLYLAGGTTWDKGKKYWLADSYVYLTCKDKWEKCGGLPQPLAYAAVANNSETIYYAGGENYGQPENKVMVIEGRDKTRLISVLSDPVSFAGAAVCDKYFYVLGGQTAKGNERKLLDAFLRIDTATGQLKRLKPYPVGEIMLMAMTTVGNEIFVFGGCKVSLTSNEVINERSAFAYSPHQNRWRKLKPYPYACRGLAACALDDNWVFIAGGYVKLEDGKEGFSETAFLYSVKQDRYYKVAPLPYAGMCVGMIKHKNLLYVFGGEDAMQHRSNRLYVCDWPQIKTGTMAD